MKILAVERELKPVPREADGILKKEAFKVWELSEKDIIREMYFNEKHCAVMILECPDKSVASEILKELPLVQEGYIVFDLMELRPYTGFGRLF